MKEQTLPAHSPLGASGAHRWMACPGSVGLSEGVSDPESEHALLGSTAHALAEAALGQGAPAWSFIGQRIELREHNTPMFHPAKLQVEAGIIVDKDMADAVDVYTDAINTWHPVGTWMRGHNSGQANFGIEDGFHCSTIHEWFYGKTDFWFADYDKRALHVWDYKHGAGIVVEVANNPQEMYYACGILEKHLMWTQIDTVVLHIVQPRGFHMDGPVRQWSITVDDLVAWMEDVLVPAMHRALVSRDTKSGEHCRFCPARFRACPQLMADMAELEGMMEAAKTAAALTNEQVGRYLDLFALCKMVGKAATETAFARLQAGQSVPGYKLAKAKVNREWKPEAEAELIKKYGKKKVFTVPELKSPAKIDALPEGETMTARWAFKPDAGLTVVPAGDTRTAVNKNVASLFKDHTKGKENAA